MNPYFPTNFNLMQSFSTAYSYNQPMPFAQFRSALTQPAQPINNIQSMYTTVQPYYNKQFLLATFGNKPEYIQIFLTLSHEDKLKMYLLMQQKKIFGEITDKEGYQKILREIAQKMQNYNTFHQINQPKIENSEQKKKKDLQSKIDLFCETSFQKLNVPKIGDIKANDVRKGSHQQDLDEVDQWVESTTAEENITENGTQGHVKVSEVDEYQLFNSQQSNKENFMVSNHISATSTASVDFNMFNFDSDMERAMTKEIGLKDAQKLSIWEIQVAQSQLNNNQPNIKEVFKKKDSKVSENVEQSNLNVRNYQYNGEVQNNFDIFGYNPIYQPETVIGESNKAKIQVQETIFSNSKAPSVQYGSELPLNSGNFPFEFQSCNSPIQEDFEVPHNHHQQEADIEDNDKEFENGFEEVKTQETNYVQIENMVKPEQFQQVYVPNQQMQFFGIKESQPTSNLTVQSYQLNNNLFDFDALESKVETPPVIIPQTTEIFLSSHVAQVQPTPQSNLDDFQVTVPYIAHEIIQTAVDLQVQPNMFNSQLYLPDIQKKYEIIEHLKIELGQPQKNFLKKQLKNKSFQCNAQFYLTILHQSNLESTSEYEHFAQQYKIVKEMHDLTQKYTAVVNQEDEEKVQRALRQSKGLYTKIYNKSTISEKYVEHLLSDKNKEKGLHYKLGKILIESCINDELISRAGFHDNRDNVLTSFCLIFILEKINSLNKLRNYTEAIILFTNEQIDKFKGLNDELFRLAEEHAEYSSSILAYIKGLLKIIALCERMINLMKNCHIKSSSNLVQTLKNCKQVKNRFSSYLEAESHRLYPIEYGKLLRECVQKNYSLDDLHVKFSQLVEKSPVCQICLVKIDGCGEYQQQKGWSHYSCFNLINKIKGKQQDQIYHQ